MAPWVSEGHTLRGALRDLRADLGYAEMRQTFALRLGCTWVHAHVCVVSRNEPGAALKRA